MDQISVICFDGAVKYRLAIYSADDFLYHELPKAIQ